MRDALVQGRYEGRAIRTACTWADCDDLLSSVDIASMFTPRTHGVQMWSLTGKYQMHLRWDAGLGGYVGRREFRTRIREIRIVPTRRVRVGGVWTARRMVAVMKSWKPGRPRHGETYRATMARTSSGLDVAMVLDRTGSMSTKEMRNMKRGAMAMLDALSSRQIWVGLVALPYGRSADPCVVNDPQRYPDQPYRRWRVSALGPDHVRNDGSLDGASRIAQDIGCLRIAGSVVVTVNGSVTTGAGHTDLGDPLHAAHAMLRKEGRADAPDVIVFMTDGEANQPSGLLPCDYFNDRAKDAKMSGQTIFTIALGVQGARCTRDVSGRYRNAFASTNLADAATASTDDAPGGCVPRENADGDHYFCRKRGGSLATLYRQVAADAMAVRATRPCRRGCW